MSLEYGPFLSEFLQGKGLIVLKYDGLVDTSIANVRNDESSYLYHSAPGYVKIDNLSARQRFFSNLLLVKSSSEKLTRTRSGGKKVIRVRGLIFIDAQLYVVDRNLRVLEMSEDRGFVNIKMSDEQFRKISSQLNVSKKSLGIPWEL